MQANRAVKEKDYSTDELLAEISRLKKELKKKKKYGLVWEEKKEDVVEMCKEKLPVLIEDKSKVINEAGEDEPVNILIEGDNYHALSSLNYTHQGKIDVIYIDPPYNTGNKSWKYNNDIVDVEDSFRHSKWLSLMEKRLLIAKRMLENKATIVIAIDHNELFNLGELCDEIFNENNRLGIIAVVHKSEGRNQEKFFSTSHEYMLIYSKNKKFANFNKAVLDEEIQSTFNRSDEIGKYRPNNYLRGGGGDHNLKKNKPHFFYPIFVSKDLSMISLENNDEWNVVLPVTNSGQERTWKTIKKTFLKTLDEGNIFAEKDKNGKVQIYEKYREEKGQLIKTFWIDKRYHGIHHGTNLLENILGSKLFDFPKSVYLVIDILKVLSKKNSIILDFFAGSGTTGHAVVELNKEDNGKRKFILVTNNENEICTEVCYPRISKVIKGYKNIKGEKVKGLGGNLRYYKTEFVDAKQTDRNKKLLTEKATDMLCIKEDTYNEINTKNKHFRIFTNGKKFTGIIYDYMEIDSFKEFIKKIDGRFSVYIFSLGDDTFDEEFEDLGNKVKLSPIPEAIMRVYRRVFK